MDRGFSLLETDEQGEEARMIGRVGLTLRLNGYR